MANKSIQMKHSNENGEWDNLYPITLTSNVYNLDGDSIDNIITKVKNDHDEDINNISNELNTLKNDHDEDINNISNELSTFKNNTNQRLDKLDNSVPNNHYVSTGFNSLQEAIFAAEGGTLYIEEGTYTITQPIKIRSNTTIIAYGVTFRRGADIDVMFINDSDGTKGGYSASKNIEIIGATFDGAGGSFVDKCTILAIGHAENIKISECTFKNLVDWHMLELNAVKNAIVENCTFENYGTESVGTEMLQIDIAKGSAQFPWFGPYDDTICDNIQIINNTFKDGVRGVGTHSSSTNKEHTRITIKDNEFLNMRGEAIYGLDWAFTKIHSNHMYNVQKGIHLRVQSRNVYNHSIIDNYLSGRDNEESRGIQITGIKDGFAINAGTIKDNKIKRFGGHSIGVDYCSTWMISGNDVTSSGKAGIIIYGSQHCTVSNNISRLNNTTGGSNYDISASAGATKVVFSGNVVDSMKTTNTTSEVIAIGNIIHNYLSLEGTASKEINNIVDGVFVP